MDNENEHQSKNPANRVKLRAQQGETRKWIKPVASIILISSIALFAFTMFIFIYAIVSGILKFDFEPPYTIIIIFTLSISLIIVGFIALLTKPGKDNITWFSLSVNLMVAGLILAIVTLPLSTDVSNKLEEISEDVTAHKNILSDNTDVLIALNKTVSELKSQYAIEKHILQSNNTTTP